MVVGAAVGEQQPQQEGEEVFRREQSPNKQQQQPPPPPSSSSADFDFDSNFFRVRGLERVEPAFANFDGKMYAGLLPIDIVTEEDEREDEVRGRYMFWLFQPTDAAASDTLTVWLNGGPGCSSFDGAVFEMGPVTSPHHPAGYYSRTTTSYDQPLLFNPWSWTNATNMLFVEQPGGVGFSDGPPPQNETVLSQDFYNFLRNFFRTFSEYANKKLFLFGESYAGYYVPSIARKIYHENNNRANVHHPPINLAGIGLGNGWMDAETQGPTVIDYAWWRGMIDEATKDVLHAKYEECIISDTAAAASVGSSSSPTTTLPPPMHPFTVTDECGVVGAVMRAAGADLIPNMSPNIYDVTTWDTYPVLFDPNSTFAKFFNDPRVKEAIHAPADTEWFQCIPGAGRRRTRRHLQEDNDLLPGQLLLAQDRPKSVIPYVAELLDGGIRVLVYNGDRDISCNAPGTELILNNMKWNGRVPWKTAPRGLWMVNQEPAGYVKTHGGLDFLVVRNSGHLVPANRPVEALDLVTRFVLNRSYHDISLPSFLDPIANNTHQDGGNKYHPTFYAILVMVVAVVCFFSGAMVSSRLRWGTTGYVSVADCDNRDRK